VPQLNIAEAASPSAKNSEHIHQYFKQKHNMRNQVDSVAVRPNQFESLTSLKATKEQIKKKN